MNTDPFTIIENNEELLFFNIEESNVKLIRVNFFIDSNLETQEFPIKENSIIKDLKALISDSDLTERTRNQRTQKVIKNEFPFIICNGQRFLDDEDYVISPDCKEPILYAYPLVYIETITETGIPIYLHNLNGEGFRLNLEKGNNLFELKG